MLEVFGATVQLSLRAAPFVLLGLLAAGVCRVLVPERLVMRWIGRPGLAGSLRAALIGVPMPVCSCGVVPLAAALRQKGASRPATLSVLITAPEVSADAVMVSWGLLGPLVAAVRVVAAVSTAMLASVVAIVAFRNRPATEECELGCSHRHLPDSHEGHRHAHALADHHHHDRDHGHDHHHHHHGHDHHDHHHAGHVHDVAALDRVVARAWAAVRAVWRRRGQGRSRLAGLWRDLIVPALRHGFGPALDGIAFWLAVGMGMAGLLAAWFPDTAEQTVWSGGPLSYLLMVAVAVPMYTCASGATPVAAALVAKGVSPGAGLVLLLAGPATSVASMALVAGQFGRRFAAVLVGSVAVGAISTGWLFDLLVDPASVRAVVAARTAERGSVLEWVSLVVLVWVVAASLRRGSWRDHTRLLGSEEGLRALADGPRLRRYLAIFASAAGAVWLATGLAIVEPGSRAFIYRLGKLVAEGGPGLVWHPPAPFGSIETRRVDYARKTDVGFRAAYDQQASPGPFDSRWHSPLVGDDNGAQRTYVTADGGLIELALTVHYRVLDPYRFFLTSEHTVDFVGLLARSCVSRYVASQAIDDLLAGSRREAEATILEALRERTQALPIGIEPVAVHVVDIHPPEEAVAAFRDVVSARDDSRTAVHRAGAERAWKVPVAEAEANRVRRAAAAAAAERELVSGATAEALTARVAAVAGAGAVGRSIVEIEAAERLLADRTVVVVPQSGGQVGVQLWNRPGPSTPANPPRVYPGEHP